MKKKMRRAQWTTLEEKNEAGAVDESFA